MSRVEELVRLGMRMPGRYAGGEYFTVPPVPPAVGDLRVAMVFPDAYEVGMSNAGLAILYSLLRETPGVFVDRFFAPWIDMEPHIRAGRAALSSRDLGLPMDEFHLVGVSLPFELTYTNVLTLLDLGRVGLHTADRAHDGPLVIAGGPGAAHPEPMAPFFDAVLVGDGEVLLPSLLDALKTLGFPAAGRAEVLPGLDLLPGVYVPSLHPVEIQATTGLGIVPGVSVQRQWIRDLDQAPDLRPFPVPAVEAVFDRVSLEIARGCPQGCRFCEAGVYYRPFRERSTEALLAEACDRVSATGMEEVGLASLSTADRRDLGGLVTALRPLLADSHASLSVSSLRAYGVGEEVLKVMAEGRTSSLTLAPESGQRLRGVINKDVRDEDLFGALDRMCRAGWNRVKLYFMLGLPEETDEDVLEIARLAREVRAIGRRLRGGRFRLVVSLSLFVPRPQTPLQWAVMDGADRLTAKVELLRGRLPRDVGLKWHDPATSRLEAIMARGDRAVAALIEEAWRRGARFDGWREVFDQGIWEAAEAAVLPDTAKYLVGLDLDAALPWDHVDLGVTKAWLQKEWRQAEAGEMTSACDPGGDMTKCSGCGLPCSSLPEPRSPYFALRASKGLRQAPGWDRVVGPRSGIPGLGGLLELNSEETKDPTGACAGLLPEEHVRAVVHGVVSRQDLGTEADRYLLLVAYGENRIVGAGEEQDRRAHLDEPLAEVVWAALCSRQEAGRGLLLRPAQLPAGHHQKEGLGGQLVQAQDAGAAVEALLEEGGAAIRQLAHDCHGLVLSPQSVGEVEEGRLLHVGPGEARLLVPDSNQGALGEAGLCAGQGLSEAGEAITELVREAGLDPVPG